MATLLMLPHMIHVGFPKAGSTFLQNWFERHPQIAYAKGGFAGFADCWSFSRRVASNPDWRCRVTSAESLVDLRVLNSWGTIDKAEPAQVRDTQKAVCNTLRELFPSAHILIVPRGFEGILRSGMSELWREGASVTAQQLAELLSRKSVPTALYEYDRIIGLYRRHFGERTLVLPYELLRDDRAAFLGAIAERLNIEPGYADAPYANPSLSAAQMHWYPRIAGFMARIPIRPLRSRLLAQHRWRAERGGWSKLVALLERAAGPAPELPRFAVQDLAHLAPLAAQLRTEPAFRPYAGEYLG